IESSLYQIKSPALGGAFDRYNVAVPPGQFELRPIPPNVVRLRAVRDGEDNVAAHRAVRAEADAKLRRVFLADAQLFNLWGVLEFGSELLSVEAGGRLGFLRPTFRLLW